MPSLFFIFYVIDFIFNALKYKFAAIEYMFHVLEHVFSGREHKISLEENYFPTAYNLIYIEKKYIFSWYFAHLIVTLTSSKVLRYGNIGINKKSDDKVCDLLYIFIL